MYQPHTDFPTRRSMYNAKTLTTSAAQVHALRDEDEALDWGTLDPTPQRQSAPRLAAGTDPASSRWVDWAIAFGLLGVLGGMTGVAGATMLAAGAVVAYKANPDIATASLASLRDARTVQVEALPVAPTEAPVAAAAVAAPAPAAAPPAKKPAPRKKSRARTTRPAAPPTPMPTSAPTVPRDDESAMSLTQLKSYLGAGPAPAPAPTYAPAPAPTYAPAPAPAAPTPSSYDADLEELLAEPIPSAGTSAPPPAPAPVARTQGTSRPAPAAAPSGIKQLSNRLAKMPNGVLILDEPFDPVPVAISTDDGAAVYVDGELLGGAPIAVVLDRGGHEITIQAEKGTVAFDLDATEGSKWCFSVKREPKLGSCK